jgi:ribonuclease-3
VSISKSAPHTGAAVSAHLDLAPALGYRFLRPALLAEALTHPSVPISAQPKQRRRRSIPGHYERLEFLGDRVLDLVIADLLWHRFADEREGQLTRRLGSLVRRETVARVALDIGLDRHIVLAPSDAAAGGARNTNNLANVCEAVIAAIYLDGGLEPAAGFIKRWWGSLIESSDAPKRDPKTRLQEWAERRALGLPVYRLIAMEGPAHGPRFTIGVRVAQSDEVSATASSKRAAETEAAAALLERLAAPEAGPR